MAALSNGGEVLRESSPESNIAVLRKRMMDAIASVMGWYNLTHSAGELYAYMFFEDRPITMDEMKTVMGMSKSSMSYAVRSLMEAKMIYKLDYKENRKELYRADPDFLSSFQKFLTAKLEHEISVVSGAVGDVLPYLKEIVDARDTEESLRQDAHRDLEKVLHAKDYYTWLQTFVERLKSETLR